MRQAPSAGGGCATYGNPSIGTPGSIDADLRRFAAKFHESGRERFAARKHEGDRLEEIAHPIVVAGLFVAQHDVHAMEGDQRRLRPMSHEWEQVDAGVTEVDVEQLSVAAAQDALELVILSAIKDRFHALEYFL